jgi:hypothetical protein
VQETSFEVVLESWAKVHSEESSARIGPEGGSHNGAFKDEWSFSPEDYKRYKLVEKVLLNLPPRTAALALFIQRGFPAAQFHPVDPILRASRDGSKALQAVSELMPISSVSELSWKIFTSLVKKAVSGNPSFDQKVKHFETA